MRSSWMDAAGPTAGPAGVGPAGTGLAPAALLDRQGDDEGSWTAEAEVREGGTGSGWRIDISALLPDAPDNGAPELRDLPPGLAGWIEGTFLILVPLDGADLDWAVVTVEFASMEAGAGSFSFGLDLGNPGGGREAPHGAAPVTPLADGDDCLAFRGAGFPLRDVAAGAGDDVVTLDVHGGSGAATAAVFDLGAGDDIFRLDLSKDAATITGLHIAAGSGDDILDLSFRSAGDLSVSGQVDLGTGDDFLFLSPEAAGELRGRLTVSGGVGLDGLVLWGGAGDWEIVRHAGGATLAHRDGAAIELDGIESLLLTDGTAFDLA